jgi:hypothetical protein
MVRRCWRAWTTCGTPRVVCRGGGACGQGNAILDGQRAVYRVRISTAGLFGCYRADGQVERVCHGIFPYGGWCCCAEQLATSGPAARISGARRPWVALGIERAGFLDARWEHSDQQQPIIGPDGLRPAVLCLAAQPDALRKLDRAAPAPPSPAVWARTHGFPATYRWHRQQPGAHNRERWLRDPDALFTSPLLSRLHRLFFHKEPNQHCPRPPCGRLPSLPSGSATLPTAALIRS